MGAWSSGVLPLAEPVVVIGGDRLAQVGPPVDVGVLIDLRIEIGGQWTGRLVGDLARLRGALAEVAPFLLRVWVFALDKRRARIMHSVAGERSRLARTGSPAPLNP